MELRPKYYRKRRRVVLDPEAPHIANSEQWMHFPGISVDITHRGANKFGKLDVYFEELGKHDKIGYCTSSLNMEKRNNVWFKTVIFHIWVHRPTLLRHNLSQDDIYTSFPHLALDRLVISRKYNTWGVGTIMSQTNKRIDREIKTYKIERHDRNL